jgi:hypothetical protein
MIVEKDALKGAIEFEEKVSARGRPVIVAKIEMELPEVEQNRQLPNHMETYAVATAQDFEHGAFKALMELADRELVLKKRAGREGKGIQRIGTRPYPFKTSFGTVMVPRIRIKHKSDGSTEIPSKEHWQLPPRMLITAGLKAAVCNIGTKETYSSTVQQIEWQTGERHILSKSSVVKILHTAGGELREANARRAARGYEAEEGASQLLGRAETYLDEDWFEEVFLDGKEITEEELPDLIDEIAWDPRELSVIDNGSIKTDKAKEGSINTTTAPASNNEQNESGAAIASGESDEVDEPDEVVTIEPDEVFVASQEAGRQWEINYSAVVSEGSASHYFTAASEKELWYQVASLLGKLKVATKQLIMLSDGAPWIRRWFDGLGLAKRVSVMCWYHLKKRSWRKVREAVKNSEDRLTIYRSMMKQLWRGRVDEAREYLKGLITDAEDGISKIVYIDIEVLKKLREYLLIRREHIPDYLFRMMAGQRIASTKVEKFNDISVSMRCKKKNGMRWTKAGVGAIASLIAAGRNKELEYWRANGELPEWEQAA